VKILIVKLSAIGDVIHTLPALNAIRRHYPEAHITWLVEEAAADLVRGHRAVDRMIVSGRKRWLAQLKTRQRREALAEIRAFWRELRDTCYDIVLDFQSLLKSGVLVWLAHGRRKIGFGKGMQHQEHSYLFLNERVPPVDMDVHALTRGLMLLKAIGIHESEAVYHVPVSDDDRQRVKALLSDQGISGSQRLVAINPVALWETKLWRNHRFAQVADRLVRDDQVEVVFTGGPDDRQVVESILEMMTVPAANLAGRTSLTQLAALYRLSAVLITTDTGPMHLAAAVGTTVVALFGPTAPWRTGPFGADHRIVRTAPACSPCFKRQCDIHRCRCMTDIGVDQVLSAARNVLGSGAADRQIQ
jgi:3-deoxy-D-manno-octulosonic-acid transferase/heptosyltransferase-1